MSLGLALLLTPGVSAADWRRAGYLSREVAYFRELARCVGPIAFVSDGRNDRELAELDGIAVVDDPRGLPRTLHRLTLPVRIARLRPRIIRTNQLAGASVALAAKWLSGARLVARGGYLGSEPWRHGGRHSLARARVALRETLLCRAADLVLVTSSEAAEAVRRTHRLDAARVLVLPNFVDTALFMPGENTVAGLVTMVGRLSGEKNVLAALDAVARVGGLRLRLVGDGPLREAVTRRARTLGLTVELLGLLDQAQLAQLLRESEIFLLPSFYEGHPKALLEAMASGVAAVVAPSPGIRSFVRHDVDAYVAGGTKPDQLADALATVHGDAALRRRIALEARERVARDYARDIVVRLECDAYRARGWLGQ